MLSSLLISMLTRKAMEFVEHACYFCHPSVYVIIIIISPHAPNLWRNFTQVPFRYWYHTTAKCLKLTQFSGGHARCVGSLAPAAPRNPVYDPPENDELAISLYCSELRGPHDKDFGCKTVRMAMVKPCHPKWAILA